MNSKGGFACWMLDRMRASAGAVVETRDEERQ